MGLRRAINRPLTEDNVTGYMKEMVTAGAHHVRGTNPVAINVDTLADDAAAYFGCYGEPSGAPTVFYTWATQVSLWYSITQEVNA